MQDLIKLKNEMILISNSRFKLVSSSFSYRNIEKKHTDITYSMPMNHGAFFVEYSTFIS
jgi:hypothetical protein